LVISIAEMAKVAGFEVEEEGGRSRPFQGDISGSCLGKQSG
jgi:hypothetical protein